MNHGCCCPHHHRIWRVVGRRRLVGRCLQHENFHEVMYTLLLLVRRDQSNDKVIGMPESPLRFSPLFDKRELNGEIHYSAHAHSSALTMQPTICSICALTCWTPQQDSPIDKVLEEFVEDELLTALNFWR
jgi:hypothetical protein